MIYTSDILFIFVQYINIDKNRYNSMKRSYIFLATGFEEIEALATADVLRRAGMEVTLVSIYKDRMVTGANGITVAADVVFDGVDYTDAGWLICPGGMPGAENLVRCEPLADLLKNHVAAGGRVAAICAAPAVVLGQLGLLKGRSATCYPGFEHLLTGAKFTDAPVVCDDKFVLGNGPANALNWALEIVSQTLGRTPAEHVAGGMLAFRNCNEIENYFG